MTRICIPDYEYQERIAKAAKLVAAKGLDAMLVVSTESDYANARYFSGFWPLFERAGVLIGANGKAVLLVGPESAIFAKDFGKIDKVMVLKEFRESADPAGSCAGDRDGGGRHHCRIGEHPPQNRRRRASASGVGARFRPGGFRRDRNDSRACRRIHADLPVDGKDRQTVYRVCGSDDGVGLFFQRGSADADSDALFQTVEKQEQRILSCPRGGLVPRLERMAL